MSNPYNSATDRASILGPTLYFKGDLSADEDLLIQGRVEGSITHTQRLTVGPQSTVKANIRAQLIIVEGTVNGDLQAEKSVFVKETARIVGNIYAPTVSILEGASFSGHIDMDGRKAAQPSGRLDSGNSGKQEPSKQPVKQEPIKHDSGKHEAAKHEAAKHEAAKHESGRADATQSRAAKASPSAA